MLARMNSLRTMQRSFRTVAAAAWVLSCLPVAMPASAAPGAATPVSALKLAGIIAESGWPAEAFSVVPSSTKDAAPLVEGERLRLLTFTGSPAVGWSLKTKAGRKRVTLELGGNAGVIVHKDADVFYAAERVAWGGFSFAGQSCISVQRVYVHAEVYDTFVAQFLQQGFVARLHLPQFALLFAALRILFPCLQDRFLLGF